MSMAKPTAALLDPGAALAAAAGAGDGTERRRQRITWYNYVKQFTFTLSDLDVGCKPLKHTRTHTNEFKDQHFI